MVMRLLPTALVVISTITSCVTKKEYVVETIDSSLVHKGQVGDAAVGINPHGQAVIQSERQAADELRLQQMVNENLASTLRREHHELQRCRNDLADPRLGGSGEPAFIPDVDHMRTATEVREQFGMSSTGDLKVVREEFFEERLKKEREYGNALKEMTSVVVKNKKDCEWRMGIARRKAGLPSERFQGDGYLSRGGVWIETRQQERSLDDAFAIKAQLEKQ